MHQPGAELAYLFRHALMRDAAYDLQLPAMRGRLHGLALGIIEAISPDSERDAFAAELAVHAHFAGDTGAELAYSWRAATFARRQNDLGALHWLEAVARLETDPARRAEALQQAGDVLLYSGQAELGRPRMQEALEIARTVGNLPLQGAILHKLAVVDLVRGRFAQAEPQLQQALAIARQCKDGDTEAAVVTNLANLKRAQGHTQEAFALQQQALEAFRASGNRRGESVSLGNIAVYLFETGKPHEALVCGEQAADLALSVGNLRTYGIARGNIGKFLTDFGRVSEAAASFRAALAAHAEVLNRPYEAYDRCRYALVCLSLGDAAAARQEWRRGYELLRDYGDAPDIESTVKEMRQACEQADVPPFDLPLAP